MLAGLESSRSSNRKKKKVEGIIDRSMPSMQLANGRIVRVATWRVRKGVGVEGEIMYRDIRDRDPTTDT